MSKLYYSGDGSSIHKETEYEELTLNFGSIEVNSDYYPSDYFDFFIERAQWSDGSELSREELIELERICPEILENAFHQSQESYSDYLYENWKANRE